MAHRLESLLRPISLMLPALAALAACDGAPYEGGDSTTTLTPEGHLTLSPCGVDLGWIARDTPIRTTFTATNRGNAALTLSGWTATPPFSLPGLTTARLEPGESRALTLQAIAADYLAVEGELVLEVDGVESLRCPLIYRVITDEDGDGWDALAAGGEDCDDARDDAHPGASEQWYDGVDGNCDGASDWDQDGDGFETAVHESHPELGGGDCQDADASIYPGATDLWYDGVDANCDDTPEWDQDGDTWDSALYGGEDCDDAHAEIAPEAAERLNGLDDNCDGSIDRGVSAEDASLMMTGWTASQVGYAIAAGDYDLSGRTDLLVGAPAYSSGKGRVYLLRNRSWEDGRCVSDVATTTLTGIAGELGHAIANLMPIHEESAASFAISAWRDGSGAGAVYAYSGLDSLTLSGAALTLKGKANAQLGAAIAADLDLDGDGLGELAAWGYDRNLARNYLAIQYGGSSGVVDWDHIDATWVSPCGGGTSCDQSSPTTTGGSPAYARMGAVGADLDGDGLHDLLLADPLADDGEPDGGAVWVLWGSRTRYHDFEATLSGSASLIARGDTALGHLGQRVAVLPDWSGDGIADLVIASELDQALFIVEGGPHLREGVIDLNRDPLAMITGVPTWQISHISETGDWNGDGIADLLISLGDEAGRNRGEALVIAGGDLSGSWDVSALTLVSLVGAGDWSGDGTRDGASLGTGAPLVSADLNGDGLLDLALGDAFAQDKAGALFMAYNTRP